MRHEILAIKIASALACEIDGSIPEIYEVFRFAFPDKGQKLMRERDYRVQEIIRAAFSKISVECLNLPFIYDPDRVFDKLIAVIENQY